MSPPEDFDLHVEAGWRAITSETIGAIVYTSGPPASPRASTGATEHCRQRRERAPHGITSVEESEALIDQTTKTFGRVDILVNNAGVGVEHHRATEDPPEHFRSMINLHINGNYWMSQAAAR